MIRTLQSKHAITLRIAEVLKEKGENWVEEVLRLIGRFHESMTEAHARATPNRHPSRTGHPSRMAIRHA